MHVGGDDASFRPSFGATVGDMKKRSRGGVPRKLRRQSGGRRGNLRGRDRGGGGTDQGSLSSGGAAPPLFSSPSPPRDLPFPLPLVSLFRISPPSRSPPLSSPPVGSSERGGPGEFPESNKERLIFEAGNLSFLFGNGDQIVDIEGKKSSVDFFQF